MHVMCVMRGDVQALACMNAHMLHAHMQVFEWRKDAQAEDKHGANTVLPQQPCLELEER
jgi:hypothetical protein